MNVARSPPISYPQRVSSLQHLHLELNKERLSLLDEINELKRISLSQTTRNARITESGTYVEERAGVCNSRTNSPRYLSNASPIMEETGELSEDVDSFNTRSDESIHVNMYIPYPIPKNNGISPYSRIQPSMADDSPVFKGTLYKLGRNRQWQEREFRTDGFLLVCLTTKKIKVNPGSVLLASYTTAEDPELLAHFYPTSPPLPRISHPLIATACIGGKTPDHGQYVDFYQPPKWIIPLSDVLEVTLLTRNRYKMKKCFVIHTSERKYILRARTEMETNCWLYLLRRTLLSQLPSLSNYGSSGSSNLRLSQLPCNESRN
ncbi:hypothetical protein K493DRAFT_370763 [Basidiobolus meristosporus CBS 931.73]|uniref:PH domain-containing protein n=1 Tax=Basidiobolus meristosporus CBS 931.73 TaxID=1314790 RepID=A0A1Y1X994_9FUNG|nr:hypothetical protein K493DRAFT_342288 [Basidiobolus meristosporus CBS 931.73]ORY06591.1 hypothetical protein K493DRAFT_370763 [Basidiobolus meristosporus CBS 931.73]|eukprot:ORX81914.1 hypothetical protein K493DRAFT_342288 [Basidiobolus meristosporus CBS 931.73]